VVHSSQEAMTASLAVLHPQALAAFYDNPRCIVHAVGIVARRCGEGRSIRWLRDGI